MANSYNSCWTGAHNDEYNARITGLEGKATTFTAQITTLNNKATTFTAQITTLQGSTTALSTTMSTKVAKAGDTMTGTLALKCSSITIGSAPTSNIAGNPRLDLADSNGDLLGYIRPYQSTANYTGIQIVGRTLSTTGSALTNALTLTIDSGGNRQVIVSQQAAWKKGLGIGSAYGNQKWAATTMNASTTSTSKTISITTVGRPVFLCMSGDINPATNQTCWGTVRIFRGSTELCRQIVESRLSSQNNPYCLTYLDAPSAGTYTYKGQFDRGAGTFTMGEDGNINAPQFSAFEI